MKVEETFNGIVHHVDGEIVFASKGCKIFKSHDGGKSWSRIAELPVSCFQKLQSAFKITRRLFRTRIHHLIPIKDDILIVFAFGNIFRINAYSQTVKNLAPINGSRPLSVCMNQGKLYYGEYRGNPERSPVHVWKSEDQGSSWQKAYTFENIRHIHGIYSDPNTSALWVTVGDEDNEAAIYVSEDDFLSVKKVISGSQQARAVHLLFTADYLFFGSDTPGELNYIYRLHRKSRQVERLQQVAGSVFWGSQADNRLFFSTVCEPSEVNKTKNVQLWCSGNEQDWELVETFRKDWWPKTLFQHGQLLFPTGKGQPNHVWVTPLAVSSDQISLKFSIDG